MIWIYKTTYNKTLPRNAPTSMKIWGSRTFMEATDKLAASSDSVEICENRKLIII